MISIFNQLFIPLTTDFHAAIRDYFVLSLLPGMLALVTFDTFYLLIFRKREKSYKILQSRNQFTIYILFIYLAFTIYLTILSRPSGSRSGMDLQLFATMSGGLAGNIYAIENLLLFIPFGVLYSFLLFTEKGAGRCILIGGSISVIIELVQFMTKRGYLQTDDVILNTLGCWIGFVIGNILKKLIGRLR